MSDAAGRGGLEGMRALYEATVSVPPLRYRGRFAPSPTGPLHFGSLVAALGSYADARAARGEWLVRMEDLDPPREQAGAADAILAALEAFGFEWDGPVVWQSRRGDAYRDALDRLAALGATYPCACTRKELQDSALAAPDGSLVYPGTCREGLPPGKAMRAVRVRVGDAVVAFDDAVQGCVVQHLAREVGDFVVRRADGLVAYQLAVVVDDAAQGITDVVRGADLLDSTPRQIHLQRLLGLPTPRYAHLPVAVNGAGEKLSKQTLAAPVDPAQPAPALVAALAFLGQAPPMALGRADARTVVAWAAANWARDRVPRVRALAVPAS
jgi:glutamyl-Q tRNA(Asp) synthetase